MIDISLSFADYGELKLRELDVKNDTVLSLLNAVCGHRENVNTCDFKIAGFGDSCWPVDVETELPILLLQIPRAIRGLENKMEFEIDFYEQGVERLLRFRYYQENTWTVSCESCTDWVPMPDKCVVCASLIESCLTSTLSKFDSYLDNFDFSIDWQALLAYWRETGEESK